GKPYIQRLVWFCLEPTVSPTRSTWSLAQYLKTNRPTALSILFQFFVEDSRSLSHLSGVT
ncbi:MAG TPA: hypothetical protein QGG93_07520, partial [Verrucomicrobiota bacterium]|nr:hypothetical protein [Verrucomicrobiota bacterium]